MAQRRSSETLSRDTFEQAPIGISYMDRDGRVLRANSAFCKLLGFDTREIESKFISEVTHEGHIAQSAAELERLWRGDIEVIDVEKRYVRADGRELWVRATTALIREDGGAPSCSVEFLRDISARKDLAAALIQNQRLLQAVIADLPVAIRACDMEGRVFLHNPAAAQLFALRTPDDSGGSTPDLHAVEMFLPDGKTLVAHQC
jgi:PAS domain S-box-containing protein